MGPHENLIQWRYFFRGAVAIGLLGLLAGTFVASADETALRLHEAAAATLGPRDRPAPAAPGVFRTAWHIILFGTLGWALCSATEAVILEIRNGPRKPPQR